mmetsp:Transcript_5859/g.7442  ORF Transcript_5859/g.7442 Transcript_5859/m.7442 type:complete len:228 (+) Transcript_5859:494-1177(+)
MREMKPPSLSSSESMLVNNGGSYCNENDDASDEEELLLKHISRRETMSSCGTVDTVLTSASSYDSLQQLSPKQQQQQQEPNSSTSAETMLYLSSVSKLLKSPSGISLTVYYGFVTGVLYALETFLSQFILWKQNEAYHHEWTSSEAGLLGLILILMGCVGNIVSGYELDRSSSAPGINSCKTNEEEDETLTVEVTEKEGNGPKYKELSILFTAGSIFSMIFFAISVL